MTCFKGTSPCNNCPYRIDAPLRKWDVQHFLDLVVNDEDYMGSIYHCHKNNGTVCRGWLIDQDNRRFPSIQLRIELSKQKISRVYLDKLYSKSPLFKSVKEMANANYPEYFSKEG